MIQILRQLYRDELPILLHIIGCAARHMSCVRCLSRAFRPCSAPGFPARGLHLEHDIFSQAEKWAHQPIRPTTIINPSHVRCDRLTQTKVNPTDHGRRSWHWHSTRQHSTGGTLSALPPSARLIPTHAHRPYLRLCSGVTCGGGGNADSVPPLESLRLCFGVERAGGGDADSAPQVGCCRVECQERRPWSVGFTFVCVSRSRRTCHTG